MIFTPGDVMERRPNFFLVGSFKAGTSSWYAYLKAHPQIFMSALKEPHYFVHHSAFRPQVVASLAAYLALFRQAGDARVVGEASAYYFSMPETPALVHAFNPEAKILISLRHPVEVAYAFYYEQRFLGREERSFAEGIDDYIALVADWPRRIAAWRALFGARVKVVLMDDVMADPARVYKEVLEFLEVDTGFVPPFAVHNRAKALPPAWRARLQTHPLLIAGMRLVYRFPVLAEYVDRVRSRRVTYAPRPPLDAALRAKLLAAFAPVVDALEQALSRDLSAWRV